MTRQKDFKRIVRDRMQATGERYTTARASLATSRTPDQLPLDRRVFGLRTSYGLAGAGWEPVFRADEIAGYLFRKIVLRDRPANVFLENGARLYLRTTLDSATQQPAYATAECDSLVDLIASERAGDRYVATLAASAERDIGHDFRLAVSREPGGQAESYLLAAMIDSDRYMSALDGFLTTRWLYGTASRASVPRVGVAAASLADEGRFRRLHITSTDPLSSKFATFVKVGALEQVLRLVEAGVSVPDRSTHPDTITGALSMQRRYLDATRQLHLRRPRPEDAVVLDAWQDTLDKVGGDPDVGERFKWLDTPDDSNKPIAAPNQELSAPSDAPAICSHDEIERAMSSSPTTTRARQRATFIKQARAHQRHYSTDWVHLRLHQPRRTTRCLDPLDPADPKAEELIASIK